jgi:hypothetical protein
MCPKTKKIIPFTTIVVALILAILASTLPPERLGGIVFFVKFFEVMIPVLAVGALIKYLLCGHHHYYKDHDHHDRIDNRPVTGTGTTGTDRPF